MVQHCTQRIRNLNVRVLLGYADGATIAPPDFTSSRIRQTGVLGLSLARMPAIRRTKSAYSFVNDLRGGVDWPLLAELSQSI